MPSLCFLGAIQLFSFSSSSQVFLLLGQARQGFWFAFFGLLVWFSGAFFCLVLGFGGGDVLGFFLSLVCVWFCFGVFLLVFVMFFCFILFGFFSVVCFVGVFLFYYYSCSIVSIHTVGKKWSIGKHEIAQLARVWCEMCELSLEEPVLVAGGRRNIPGAGVCLVVGRAKDAHMD